MTCSRSAARTLRADPRAEWPAHSLLRHLRARERQRQVSTSATNEFTIEWTPMDWPAATTAATLRQFTRVRVDYTLRLLNWLQETLLGASRSFGPFFFVKANLSLFL